MFPPLRMNTLFPTDRPVDSEESLFNKFRNQLGSEVDPNFINAINAHRFTPINRYADPLTTKPMDTRLAPNPNIIGQLDMAKLKQNEEKIQASKEKEKANLNFKEESLDKNLQFKGTKQEQDNAIRKNRADVYKFKAEHPGMKFDYSGPNVIVSDPISGTSHDTGIPTGHLSDEDKINLNSSDRMAEIGARANESRKTNSVNNTERHLNRLGEIEATGDQTRQTNKDKPTSSSATQSRVGYANKARELANSNPAFAPYIKIDGNNFTVTPPSSATFGNSGPDEDTYHKINESIYGSSTSKTDDKNKSDKPKTKDTTKTDTKSDPLGIR